MKILDKLARDEGKTIITSIHQPSSAVFFAFDKLMLLADGNVVYFGTPIDSLEYVRKLKMECPAGYNAVRKKTSPGLSSFYFSHSSSGGSPHGPTRC